MQKIVLFALFSISLLCAPLSHAMDLNQALQELSDQGLEREEDQYSDGSASDSELTNSEGDELEQEREKSPLDNYRNQLRNYARSCDQNPIANLRAIIMLPKPEDQTTHEMAHKFLMYRIAAMLVNIKYADANPNEINPETGNTALADFFINHHANNAYMPVIIESMAEYGARLTNITLDESSFRHLVQQALLSGTLTQDQYNSLLESTTPALVEHFKAERVRQKNLRAMQSRRKKAAQQKAIRTSHRWRPRLQAMPEETAEDLASARSANFFGTYQHFLI